MGEEKRLENENKVHRKGHETVGYSQTGHEPNMGNENWKGNKQVEKLIGHLK